MKRVIKNSGFLIILVVMLITVLLSNFLIGYKIILRNGSRLSSLLQSYNREEIFTNLETLIFDELYSIDLAINQGEYQNITTYMSSHETYEKIWYGNNNTPYNKHGYYLYKLTFNSKTLYQAQNKNYTNFKSLMETALKNYNYLDINTFKIELVKILKNPLIEEDIVFKGVIFLEFRKKNINLLNPDSEILKEFYIEIKNYKTN